VGVLRKAPEILGEDGPLADLGRQLMISDDTEGSPTGSLDCSPEGHEAARAGALHGVVVARGQKSRRRHLGQILEICTGDSGGDRLQAMPVMGCGKSARG